MGLKGGWACLKYTVFFVNFLFWLAGIGILSLAAYFRFVATTDIPEGRNGTYLLMAAGGLITLVGFLGCCGACKESTCMLVTFFFFLLIIMVLEIAAGVLVAKSRPKVEPQTRALLADLLKEYEKDLVKQKSMDEIQQYFACCGIDGPSSWQIKAFNVTELPIYKVPKSCCVDIKSENCETSTKIVGEINPDIIYSKGCVKAVVEFLPKQMTLLMGVAFGVGALEIFGLIFSMMLCCAIRNN